MPYPRLPLTLLAIGCAAVLSACGGDDPVPEERRAQDDRVSFAPSPTDAAATTFAAMANGTATTDGTSRWAGVLNGAAYRIEVPATWNGKLVMYAHGYNGEGNVLAITNPSIRRHLIENGYAWAASSYTKNFYDVRAGVEDTNALARAFNSIAAARSRPLAAPTKTYIIGHSMGGHIAAAAVEAETLATANNKVTYNGAVPMCGVLGDTELFDYLQAAQMTAQTIAGQPTSAVTNWPNIKASVQTALFTQFPQPISAANPVPATIVTTPLGTKWREVMKNLTGGARPLYEVGFSGYYTRVVWDTFGGDGTVNGIFNRASTDTRGFTYAIDGDLAGSTALNADTPDITAAADFNRQRRDGLRWVPKTNGDINVPVVTLHTLGDMYVPFSMEQIYRKRIDAKGKSNFIVQRAIRGIAHCDFTINEQKEAFDAMVAWEAGGAKPAGDDVLTAATVASPSYGCAYTRNTTTVDDSTTTAQTRAALAVGYACPP